MLTSISDFIRTLVRPIVTLGLVGAFVAANLIGQTEAAHNIGAMAGIAMAFWFSDRTHENATLQAGAGVVDAVAAANPGPTVANGRPMGYAPSFEPDETYSPNPAPQTESPR